MLLLRTMCGEIMCRDSLVRGALEGRRRVATGFTIVELLIVVVVIAILAAIVVVSYNGISAQAKESALKADLSTGAKQLGMIKVEEGSYPDDATGLKKSSGTIFSYTGDENAFCLSATSDSLAGKSFKITEAGVIESGDCEEIISTASTTMQTFTPAACATLADNQIVTLTDARGTPQRSYSVARFGTAGCWMLHNLRLGSTVSAMTLTPSDSNVVSNFTLPKLNDGSRVVDSGLGAGNDYDTPYVYGPVSGDDDSGANQAKNYGYLYNFSAATAGTTRASLPANGGHAPSSICPKGWRLPSGGAVGSNSDFARLDQQLGGTGDYQGESPAYLTTSWLSSGSFGGVFSGYWNGGFYDQTSYSSLWSRTAYDGDVRNAFNADFTSGYILPGNDYLGRYYGFGVRCLLN